MNKKHELVKNTAIIGIGRMFNQMAYLFLLPLYTVFLSTSEYGAVDLIITYVALLASAITFQLEMAAFRFLIDARDNDDQKKEVITNIIQIILLAVAAFLLVSLLLSQFISVKYSALIVLNICVVIFANIFLQFARGLGYNSHYAKASVLNGIVTMAGSYLFIVYLRMGASGVLFAMFLSNLASALYIFWSLRLYRYINFSKGNKVVRKKLMSFSLPMVPNALSWWIISVSDRTIVTLSLGLAATGIYAVSAKYALIFASVFAIFSMALMESVSVHINAKDSYKFLSETNGDSIKLFASLGLALIVACPFVFTWFIGENFQSARNYVPILIVASFLNAVIGIYSAIYIAKKMTKQVATTTTIAAVINIVLTIGFIKLLGVYAAALATAIAYLVMAVYRHYDLKKIVHIHYEKWLLLKIGTAYAAVIGLYYMKSPVANLINIGLAVSIAILLNRSTIGSAKNMFFGMLKAKGGKTS